jgi:hypothetical protein
MTVEELAGLYRKLYLDETMKNGAERVLDSEDVPRQGFKGGNSCYAELIVALLKVRGPVRNKCYVCCTGYKGVVSVVKSACKDANDVEQEDWMLAASPIRAGVERCCC